MNNLGWIRSNSHREFQFHQCSISHRYYSLPNCPNWFLFSLATSMYSDGIGNDNSFRYIQVFSGHDMVVINKFSRHTPDTSFASTAVAISFRKSLRLLFLQRVVPHALQRGHSSPRPKWRVLLPRPSSRLSGGGRFDVVRDLLV